ncbi:unnamed protein product [Cylicostephanus goldi]|uniref:Uncharacterized protein n=1 Tax=Cylicostephanus goldi TaxID=71465 RepID=A0A3P6RBB6_CYLGO|nr:unnamed protein product [Cylicostephanus goldi]
MLVPEPFVYNISLMKDIIARMPTKRMFKFPSAPFATGLYPRRKVFLQMLRLMNIF